MSTLWAFWKYFKIGAFWPFWQCLKPTTKQHWKMSLIFFPSCNIGQEMEKWKNNSHLHSWRNLKCLCFFVLVVVYLGYGWINLTWTFLMQHILTQLASALRLGLNSTKFLMTNWELNPRRKWPRLVRGLWHSDDLTLMSLTPDIQAQIWRRFWSKKLGYAGCPTGSLFRDLGLYRDLFQKMSL